MTDINIKPITCLTYGCAVQSIFGMNVKELKPQTPLSISHYYAIVFPLLAATILCIIKMESRSKRSERADAYPELELEDSDSQLVEENQIQVRQPLCTVLIK